MIVTTESVEQLETTITYDLRLELTTIREENPGFTAGTIEVKVHYSNSSGANGFRRKTFPIQKTREEILGTEIQSFWAWPSA